MDKLVNDPEFTAPSGESQNLVKKRVVQAIEEITHRHPEENVVIVAHGATIGIALSHFVEGDTTFWTKYSKDNTVFTELCLNSNTLLSFNKTDHLKHPRWYPTGYYWRPQGWYRSCQILGPLDRSTRGHRPAQRGLHRKLQHEGTSYQDLLKAVCLKRAMQYLRDALTVEQTSELLGYSETSAFSRAFKSWTGRSPQEYRAP